MNKKKKIKRSLNFSIVDGSFYSAMSGFGDAFFSAFAIFLRATNMQLALLSALPQTFGSIMQIFTSDVLRIFKNRKVMACVFAFLQSLMYLPIAFVFLMGEFKVYYLIILVCFYWLFALFPTPAWNSWMGDLINENKRGKYFGRRNKIVSMASFVSFLGAGFVLQALTNGWTAIVGFVTLFLLAFLFRFISFLFLLGQYEPGYSTEDGKDITFFRFLKKAKYTNYGLFVIFLTLMNFSVYVCAPFIAPYFLRDIGFDYKIYTILLATSVLVRIIMMPLWGKLIDRYGTKKVLTLSAFIMPLNPLLLILNQNLFYLILVQAFSGFVWSGFELSSYSFIFDTTEAAKRTKYISYYNVINGVMIFIGALLGAFIMKNFSLFGSAFNSVFLMSFVLRYAVVFFFITKIHEVRIVRHISYKNLLIKSLRLKPHRGFLHHNLLINFRGKHK